MLLVVRCGLCVIGCRCGLCAVGCKAWVVLSVVGYGLCAVGCKVWAVGC